MINDGFISTRKNVLICDTQPVAVEGMKWLIENSGDLHFAGSVPTLEAVYEMLNPGSARMAAELAEARILTEIADMEPETTQAAVTPMALRDVGETDSEALEMEALIAEVLGDRAPETDVTIREAVEADAATTGIVWTGTGDTWGAAPILDVPSVADPIDAVVIDKGLGIAAVMELLQKLTSTSHPTPAVVWGAAITEAEALRLLQAGARGILRRTSESGTLLTCLRAVTSGGTWMEDGIFGTTEKLFNPRRSQLTHREKEVVVLVEKGLRNREIGRMLGIQTGTVKIHLKHIFEKTGVRGRYGLAFTGLQKQGSIAMTASAQFTA